jgi:hypothetical protein
LGFELGLFVHFVGQRPKGPVRPYIMEPLVSSDGESVTAHWPMTSLVMFCDGRLSSMTRLGPAS